MQDKQSGQVEVMLDEVSYHGHWQLAGQQLKVSYGSWEESTIVAEVSPPVEAVAQRLLAEIVDRDLTYRGRAPKE